MPILYLHWQSHTMSLYRGRGLGRHKGVDMIRSNGVDLLWRTMPMHLWGGGFKGLICKMGLVSGILTLSWIEVDSCPCDWSWTWLVYDGIRNPHIRGKQVWGLNVTSETSAWTVQGNWFDWWWRQEPRLSYVHSIRGRFLTLNLQPRGPRGCFWCPLVALFMLN